MHFNRTEFAAKTQIRLLALALLILMFLLSSCTEDIDLEEFTFALEKMFETQYHRPANLGSSYTNAQAFSVDSVGYDSIAVYKVFSHVQFDSVTALTGLVFQCRETDNQNGGTLVEHPMGDTSILRGNEIYHYKTRIKTLKANTSYVIYGRARFLVGKDTMDTFLSVISYRTQ